MWSEYLRNAVVEFSEFSTVFLSRIVRFSNRWVNGTSQRKDIISQDNSILSKESSLHDHIVELDIIFLIGIDKNDIKGSV